MNPLKMKPQSLTQASKALIRSAVLLLVCNTVAVAATFTRTIDKSVPAEAGGTLVLTSRYAELTAIPAEASKGVSMQVTIAVKADNEAEAEKFFDAVVTDLEGESDKIIGRVDFDGEKISQFWRFRTGPELAVTVKVPANFNLDLRCTSGDVNASGIQGTHQLASTSGRVSAIHCAGNHDFKTTSGDILINDSAGDFNVRSTSGSVLLKNCPGQHSITTVSGSITVRDGSGPLQLKSTSGEIGVENTPGAHQARSSSGDIVLSIPGGIDGPITVSSTSGDVTVKIPATTPATVQLKTVSGDISGQFDVMSAIDSHAKKKVEGTINGGGQPIKINTVSGDIALQKI